MISSSESITGKSDYEIYNGKYIYKKSNGRYYVLKTFNGKRFNYGSFDTFKEACDVRDQLLENNWILPEDIRNKENEEKFSKNYFLHVQLMNNKYFHVFRPNRFDNKYMGSVKTLEEALFFRDLAEEGGWFIGKPEEYDLITNNPYIIDGLKYPVPDRLKPEPDGRVDNVKGSIRKKGKQSYHLYHGEKYVMSCRTYEYAYYMRIELNKVDWDLSYLQDIIDGYPKWYTWLLNFYKYISPRKHDDSSMLWCFSITPKWSNDDKLENIYFHNLEDALWERDLYVKYGFSTEDVVYCADDRLNPYYDMDLPPYPERTIKNVSDNKPRFDKLIKDLCGVICDGYTTQSEVSEVLSVTGVTIRKLMGRYGTCWEDFKVLCLAGEDPLDVLEYQYPVYTPDLSIHYSKQNYISEVKGRGNPFIVQRRGVHYGGYPTRKMANKVVSKLRSVGWDKSKLKGIQDSVGFVSVVGSKRWVYSNKNSKGEVTSYSVRKKDKNKRMMNFGTYKDKAKAEYVRDRLVECGWDRSEYSAIRCEADSLFGVPVNPNRYVYRVSKFNYSVRKCNVDFGRFSSLVVARLFRDGMIRCGWDESFVGCVFCDVLGVVGGYWYYVNSF